ncbi:DSN1 protein, partial [Polypterus senegalus]|nr:kinetochore-associated protein DSN1 homolog isoform X1 [Polypterus senegalus]MBN3289761.1 DSN1 protein [Polypterus senegalus]
MAEATRQRRRNESTPTQQSSELSRNQRVQSLQDTASSQPVAFGTRARCTPVKTELNQSLRKRHLPPPESNLKMSTRKQNKRANCSRNGVEMLENPNLKQEKGGKFEIPNLEQHKAEFTKENCGKGEIGGESENCSSDCRTDRSEEYLEDRELKCFKLAQKTESQSQTVISEKQNDLNSMVQEAEGQSGSCRSLPEARMQCQGHVSELEAGKQCQDSILIEESSERQKSPKEVKELNKCPDLEEHEGVHSTVNSTFQNAQCSNASSEGESSSGKVTKMESILAAAMPDPRSHGITSPPNRRKSWRKSISRSLPTFHKESSDHQELGNDIGQELPEDQRFARLLQASFEYALEKLKNSVMSEPEIDLHVLNSNVSSITKDVKWLLNNMQKAGKFEKVTQKPPEELCSDPEIRKTMENLSIAAKSLKLECVAWDKLLKRHKELSEEKNRELEQAKISGVTCVLPAGVESSQSRVLNSKPDYQKLLDSQRFMIQSAETLMDKHRITLRGLITFQNHVETTLKKVSAQLGKQAFPEQGWSQLKNLARLPKVI